MVASSAPVKELSPRRKAAITNGTRLHLGKVGEASIAGRRFADLVRLLSDERGGAEALDTARRSAIRSYAALRVSQEMMETALARGESFDAEAYGQLGDRCDRLLRRMGPATHHPGAARPMSFDEKLAARRAAECSG